MSKKSRIIWMLIILMTIQIFAKAVFANSMVPGPGPEANQYTYEIKINDNEPCIKNSTGIANKLMRKTANIVQSFIPTLMYIAIWNSGLPIANDMEFNPIRIYQKGRKCSPAGLIVNKEVQILNGQNYVPSRAPEISENKVM